MYLLIVSGTMLILPLGSVVFEFVIAGSSFNAIQSMGKWFLFWAFGVRLFVAGLRQVVQPSFTAKHIFEIQDPKANPVVQELGFANISFGVVGILSLLIPGWSIPALLLGTCFYGLAGINHIFKKKNKTEWIAMISDLYAAVIFGMFLVESFWNIKTI